MQIRRWPLALVWLAACGQAAEVEETLVSVGAVAVEWSSQYGDVEWSAMAMMDGRADLGWSSSDGAPFPHVMVFELIEPARIQAVEFVNAPASQERSNPGLSARTVRVEVSSQGPKEGFGLLAELELAIDEGPQRFDIEPANGRWVRLSLPDNHGSARYTELMDVRLLGEFLEPPPDHDLTGTWETRWNQGNGHARAYLSQRGGQVTGCYDWDSGRLAGGLDDRVITYRWTQSSSRGLVTMAVNREGTRMHGYWTTGERTQGWWMATRVGERPEKDCGTASFLADQIDDDGRATVYGIHFDFDSDVIRPDSYPVLESVATLLRERPALRLEIVGHTDDRGADAYNLALSEKRVASVVRHLSERWEIAPDRLSSRGAGESEPVGSNQTELGRAANRRVEIVRRP